MNPNDRSGWTQPQPARLPKPTYWPAALALGAVLLLWGMLTAWFISAVGLVLFIGSLSGWIGDILHEHTRQ